MGDLCYLPAVDPCYVFWGGFVCSVGLASSVV